MLVVGRESMKVSAILLLALITGAAAQNPAPTNPSPHTIVFVCEHGAALSVISAAYFNKLAAEQHLGWHAAARGVTPQENISVAAAAGLKKDGVANETTKPQAITQEDLDHADYVVTFLPLPQNLTVRTPMQQWDDVKWNANEYGKVRDGILQHLQQLAQELAAKPKAR